MRNNRIKTCRIFELEWSIRIFKELLFCYCCINIQILIFFPNFWHRTYLCLKIQRITNIKCKTLFNHQKIRNQWALLSRSDYYFNPKLDILKFLTFSPYQRGRLNMNLVSCHHWSWYAGFLFLFLCHSVSSLMFTCLQVVITIADSLGTSCLPSLL